MTSTTTNGITVTGTGRAGGPPTVARVELGVRVTDGSVAAALQRARHATQLAIDAGKRHGVAEPDMQTHRFTVHPHHDGRSGQISGYEVVNTLRLTVREIDGVGDLIGAVADAAGNSVIVNGIDFAVEDPSELLDAARAAAWQDVVAKADQLADLAGVTRGDVVDIVEGSGGPVPLARAARMEALSSGPPIQAGAEEVTVSLTVTFAL